jgi:class 3 adenylate cyclase/tetratricopeptide (TPR) repeat protein
MPEQPDAATTLEGERKTVTALFADIKGSMDLMEDLDPEEARAIVDPAIRLMIEAALRYDGYVVQSTGDGIFALFGAPVAHEDHPQRALYSALRMQDEVKRYAERLRAEQGVNLQVRVGVNTGEVVVRSITTGAGQTEYTPIGHSTSLASRLQTLANPGSIAVSETVRKLVEGYFLLEPLGPARVKGVSEPVNVYEVTGLGPLRTRLQRSAGRGLTKFVGREREMEALRHAADQAQSGHGQIVAAVAEPGVGKSRLYFEFKAKNQSGWMVLETFSVSHGKASAYLPMLDLLLGYFKITREDDERTRREKVTGRVLALDRSLEDALPYLFSLFGIVENADPLAQMDGRIKKRRTLEAIKRILLRESLNQPLIVIFEDLHWIDEQTRELLNLLADSIATAKILLLVNYRPEYSNQWNNKTYYTQLRLDPLPAAGAEEMLDALLGDGKDLVALKRLIIERTEGNPFFLEEIAQALFEDGVLQRNDSVKLARSMNAVKVPATVEAVLASRIDRLPAEAKDLLQTLAVIGREFSLSLIRAVVSRSEDDLNRLLDDLQLGEFIYEQPAVGDTEYIFKHALTQEVSYNSVLSERRKQIHEQAAQAMEASYATNLADHYDSLARHYQRSGDASKAVAYLRLAAQQAFSRSAYVEAMGQLNAALELVRTQPEGLERDRNELEVRFSLGMCTIVGVSGGSVVTTVSEMLVRALDLSRRIGDDARRFEILDVLSRVYSDRTQYRESRALGDELLEIASRMSDPAMEGRARCGRGLLSMREGDLIAAIEELDRAAKLSTAVQGRPDVFFNWRVESGSVAALTLWMLGFPDRAATRSRESFTVARESAIAPGDLVLTLYWSSVLYLFLGEPKTAFSNADQAISLAHEHGIESMVPVTSFNRGWALTQLGRLEEGLFEMLRWQTELVQTIGNTFQPWLSQGLANVYVTANSFTEGLATVSDGLDAIERTGTWNIQSDLLRLKGEFLLIRVNGGTAEAAECFREAIEVARRQSAKSWELRATMSLARLMVSQGRRDEARSMLADIYNWFTEGFDTADLIDAKKLLEELAN